ncbi:MAG: hypothetical protein LBV06_02965 [Propionibacteriaceae bacterium]|jgi:hypothetical protein|nr:hypothetical protein [Propionibacteriaceae bacterium]
MSLRPVDEPWGLARFAYAYLAALIDLAGSGLIAIITSGVVGATPLCAADTVGLCMLAVNLLAGSIAAIVLLFLLGRFWRLGWQWAGWCTALILVVAQVVMATDMVDLVWLALVVPGLGAAIAFRRPDRDWSPARTHLVQTGWIVVVVQFLVWLIVTTVS